TMRPVMEELAKTYEQKTRQKILLDHAESGQQLIKIEQTEKGDLYVAHDPFLAGLTNKGLCEQAWVTAYLHPVIVVSKGNPKNIHGLRDLGKTGIRVILPHQIYSTIGHAVPRMTEKAGIKQAIEKNIISRTRGGGEAANAVIIGTADAAIVWDAVAYLRRDNLDLIPIEQEYQLKSGIDAVTTSTYGYIDMGLIRVTIATLKHSKNLKAATSFAEFVQSKENKEIWKKFGYTPAAITGVNVQINLPISR
ncbi:MAG: extracellular solute-binding protein, partial [Elusimicrobiota bacterium]